MKTQKIIGLFLISVLIAGVISGCKKYERGGYKNKTEKNLVKSWRLDKYLRNNADETSVLYIKNYQETYSDKDIYSRTYIDKNNKSISESGTWEFDKEQGKIKISGVGSMEIADRIGTVSSSYYIIIKLNKNEFWYYFINGGDKHEFRFVKI